jgi:hypothetical protein
MELSDVSKRECFEGILQVVVAVGNSVARAGAIAL